MKAAGISDRGKVRENNEDAYLIYEDQSLGLYAVADGMGGHAAGEVASTLALETIKSILVDRSEEINTAAKLGQSLQAMLGDILTQANNTVLAAGKGNPRYSGMGTTVTLVLTVAGQAWLCHIGDSRAYRINDSEVLQLSTDHTLVSQLIRSGQISEEDGENHPQRNILTQALGTDDNPEFEIKHINLKSGDTLLLCSDGLCGLIDDHELLTAVCTDESMEEILVNLVSMANERGGKDNITAVLVQV